MVGLVLVATPDSVHSTFLELQFLIIPQHYVHIQLLIVPQHHIHIPPPLRLRLRLLLRVPLLKATTLVMHLCTLSTIPASAISLALLRSSGQGRSQG